MSESSPDAILGRVPSGIFILTHGTDHDATGMLVSWVMQAGFDPPMVTVALGLGRHACERLTDGQPFVVNVVGEADSFLMKHFATRFEPGQAAFDGLDISHSARGVVILGAAIGHLECEPTGHVDSQDHRIFLAKVVGGRLATDQAPWKHVRKTGGRY